MKRQRDWRHIEDRFFELRLPIAVATIASLVFGVIGGGVLLLVLVELLWRWSPFVCAAMISLVVWHGPIRLLRSVWRRVNEDAS